jgi:hypothetical protein
MEKNETRETAKTIDGLSDVEKGFLFFALEHFAAKGECSKCQEKYLADLKAAWPEVTTAGFALSDIEGIDSLAAQTTILKAVMTFFYLKERSPLRGGEEGAFLASFSASEKLRESLWAQVEAEQPILPQQPAKSGETAPETAKEADAVPKTVEGILQELKTLPEKYAGREDTLSSILSFQLFIKNTSDSTLNDISNDIDDFERFWEKSPAVLSWTCKSHTRKQVRACYRKAQAFLESANADSIAAFCAERYIGLVEEREQEMLFLLRLLAQKADIAEYLPRTADLFAGDWREELTGLLQRELGKAKSWLKSEDYYLDKLDFSATAATFAASGDGLAIRVADTIVGTIFPEYETNRSEVTEKIQKDLGDAIESYVPKASSAFGRFFERKFTIPFKYLVLEITAKLGA